MQSEQQKMRKVERNPVYNVEKWMGNAGQYKKNTRKESHMGGEGGGLKKIDCKQIIFIENIGQSNFDVCKCI